MLALLLAGCTPEVTITEPEDGDSFAAGETITFTGEAFDQQYPDLDDDAYVWTSDIDGEIGTGPSFTTANLSEGEHTITLTVTDPDEWVGEDSITITVGNGMSPTTTTTTSGTQPDDGDVAQNLQDHVRKLSDELGNRSMDDYANLESAAAYIKAELNASGYAASFENFTFMYDGEELSAKNVVAEISTGSSDAVIIVGAHYDTADNPGANDDASGVAVLIELAAAMASEHPSKTVRFVAFANEEDPYFGTDGMGSQVHATAAQEKGENIEGELNLDMVGIFPEGQNYMLVGGNTASQSLVNSVAESFAGGTSLPMGKMANANAMGLYDTDVYSFYEAGYKAVWLTSAGTDTDTTYHTDQDVYTNLNYTSMAETVKGLKAVLQDIAN